METATSVHHRHRQRALDVERQKIFFHYSFTHFCKHIWLIAEIAAAAADFFFSPPDEYADGSGWRAKLAELKHFSFIISSLNLFMLWWKFTSSSSPARLCSSFHCLPLFGWSANEQTRAILWIFYVFKSVDMCGVCEALYITTKLCTKKQKQKTGDEEDSGDGGGGEGIHFSA